MSTVTCTGILKMGLDDLSQVKSLLQRLPPEAKPLSDENIHVTLVHQKIMKQFNVKGREFTSGPRPILQEKIYCVSRPGRTSWISVLENQEEMQRYVDDVMKELGGTKKPENRVFHVSLANMTGSPFSSVGDVRWSDVCDENLV